MCFVSMVQEGYTDRWRERQPHWPLDPWHPTQPGYPQVCPLIPQKSVEEMQEEYRRIMERVNRKFPKVEPLSDDEILDFRKMIEKAKEYDKRNGEPECPSEEKTQKMIEALQNLGVSQEKIDEIVRIVKE